MVATVASLPRQLQGIPLPNMVQEKLQDALMAKLGALDPKVLDQLHKTFYEAAQKGTPAGTLPSAFVPFAVKSPTDALFANFGNIAQSYYSPIDRAADSRESSPPSGSDSQPEYARPQGTNRFYGAGQSKGPGIFSSPAAEKAAAALRQQQAQTLAFVNNQLGGAYASGNMAEFMGQNMCFEDALAAMLFKIANDDQRDLMEELRNYERGDQGLKGLMASGARGAAGAVAGAAGGLLGGWWGGAQGALSGSAIGYDVGERIANNYTGQHGSSNSKAAQFERIKMKVNEMTQLIQMLSNVLHAFDSANRNTISNMRG